MKLYHKLRKVEKHKHKRTFVCRREKNIDLKVLSEAMSKKCLTKKSDEQRFQK